MDINYLKGYLDGLCDVLDSGVYYDNDKKRWVCDEGQKTISINGITNVVVVDTSEVRSFDIKNIMDVFYNCGEVSFKVFEVI